MLVLLDHPPLILNGGRKSAEKFPRELKITVSSTDSFNKVDTCITGAHHIQAGARAGAINIALGKQS